MAISSLLRKAAGLARVATRIPGVGALTRAIPGAGLAIGAYEIGSAALGAVRRPAAAGGLPALPGGDGMMVPGAPGAPVAMGRRSIFRDDPNVAAFLKQFAIPARALKEYYRAPKGFIVLRDAVGDPYGIPKVLAKQYLGWKPAKKPPISVRQWSAMKHIRTTMRSLKKVDATARQLAAFGMRRGGRGRAGGNTPFTVVETGPGNVNIGRRKK